MSVKKQVDFRESKPETSIWDSPVRQNSFLMNYSKEKTRLREDLNLSDKTSGFMSRVRVTRMLWSKVALPTLMDCRHSPGYI